MEFADSYTTWLRKNSKNRPSRDQRLLCHKCKSPISEPTETAFAQHWEEKHYRELRQQKDAKAYLKEMWSKSRDDSKSVGAAGEREPTSADFIPQEPPPGEPLPEEPQTVRQKRVASAGHGHIGGSPQSHKRVGTPRSVSPTKRSRGRHSPIPGRDDAGSDDAAAFKRGPQGAKGRLWNPDDTHSSPRPQAQGQVAPTAQLQLQQQQQGSRSSHASSHASTHQDDGFPSATSMIKQPETRPISQEQLVAEVKGIYAGLVMVESKCIEVDNAQNSAGEAAQKLNNEQWMALIALHRTLLHEHHDFFLASQHPSASQALRRLASKYAMPARMWRHGIHSFLELLRHRLPGSLEHMLAFIYLAYSMMALLYETVPAFEDTWIECLGDLGRYRMAIEDDDIRDREVWTQVSRHWYSKASDKAPTTGRLYHHLAILARPNAIQQLYYYSKSLCVPIPFAAARESIMTLFDPVLATQASSSKLPEVEFYFVFCHGILFSKKHQDKFQSTAAEYASILDNRIARMTRRFLEVGYHIGIANSCAILGYGEENNPIMRALKAQDTGEVPDQVMDSTVQTAVFKQLQDALSLANQTHDVILRRFGDPHILPNIHVTLVFAHHLSYYPEANGYFAPSFPWKLLSLMLNTLLVAFTHHSLIESDVFPQTGKDPLRPLPEDYALRGLSYVEKYHPNDFFVNDKTDDDEKSMDLPSMYEERRVRILWLGVRLAREGGQCLRYDLEARRFGVAPEFDLDIPTTVLSAAPKSDMGADADSPSVRDLGELPDATDSVSSPSTVPTIV